MLAGAFSHAPTTDDVANVLVTLGCSAFDAPRGLVGLMTADRQTLKMIQMGGFPAKTVAAWTEVPMEMAAPLTDVVRTTTAAFYERPEDVTTKYPHLAAARSPGDSALAALPLVTPDGRAIGVIGLVFDDPQTFADDDREQMAALAGLCAQAIDRASLYEEARRERERAEAANRAKDMLLAMVSHDLRNPVSAVLAWARRLQKQAVAPETYQKGLAVIERNAIAQAKLIDDLMEVSALTTGEVRLDLAAVDVVALVESALDTARPAAEAKGIRLLFVTGEGARTTVVADGDRLRQIVWNLLSNAVKFTPREGTIEVAVQHRGSEVEIQVRDSGVGIEAEFLPHVFDRFRQADTGHQGRAGLGLGLAIVKHLVDLHSGVATVVSPGLDRGATFTVKLPAAAHRS